MIDAAELLLAGTDDAVEEVVIVVEVAPSEEGEGRVTKPEGLLLADGVMVDVIATVVVDEKLPVKEAVVLIWADEITATEDVDLKAVDVKAVTELSLNVAETTAFVDGEGRIDGRRVIFTLDVEVCRGGGSSPEDVCCCVELLVAPSSVWGIPAGHSLDPDSLSPFCKA